MDKEIFSLTVVFKSLANLATSGEGYIFLKALNYYW